MKNLLQEDTVKQSLIKCPHCGFEYLPCEIYVKGQLIGKTENIIKDPIGKILYYDFEEKDKPELEDHFICENCEKPFVIEADLSFKTKKEEDLLDFTNQYSSLLDD